MKVETKMIALCLFALAIGITAMLPILYLTPNTRVTVQAELVCDPYVYSITIYPDSSTLQTGYDDSAFIDINVAYTFHSMANFKDIDAKIEVYNYHIYSDQTSIANITHSIAITKDVPDPTLQSGFTSAIADRNKEKSTYTFADGTIFDITETIGYVEGSRVSGIIYDQGPTDDLCPMHDVILLSASKGEKSAQALYNVRNAQKIYIDITMALSVTYKHPNNLDASAIITTTVAHRAVLFHVELTKMDDGNFRYTTEKAEIPDNNTSFPPPYYSNPPPDDSKLPSNIIKLPPSTIIAEPASMTLLAKAIVINTGLQKLTT